ncbi:permease-like cell division protein FtsX [Egicoccus halophilus]|uniref:Cell division protein FtsX n=1 Tax=Egicoccus halophilus TaxID=1670830 RepID=A0A8J3ETF9_9ACTN|nr:permease-like cell division protein FtsX [Egicoccus halophilus]GGI09523.1 cell division protein FtsX [Egicoccus halophilus]
MSARWRYILQEAFVGLRRNLMMTVAVILSVTVSLTLLGASLLLSDQVELATDDWVGQVEVSIFLCDGRTCPEITDEQQQQLREDLEDQPVVAEVFFESKQDAYDRFVELFRDQPNLVESVDPDVLPASFRVRLENPQLFNVIAEQFEAYPGVEEIVDQRQVLDQFLRFTNVIRNAALIVAAIQLVAAGVLIANTIRVAAFARREQTSIMKLVGASNWYIRLPFVLEGVLAGVLGAFLSWGLLYASVPRVAAQLRRDIELMPFIDAAHVIAVGPWLLAAGVGIAAFSSVVALRRFLDV